MQGIEYKDILITIIKSAVAPLETNIGLLNCMKADACLFLFLFKLNLYIKYLVCWHDGRVNLKYLSNSSLLSLSYFVGEKICIYLL